MNKFLWGSTKVYKKASQVSEVLQPYFNESKGIQGSIAAFLQDSPLSFFPYESLNSKKAKDFFADELHTKAMEVWESQGSRWVHQGWSIATKRGREKVEKRKEKKKTKEGEKVAPAKARFRVP